MTKQIFFTVTFLALSIFCANAQIDKNSNLFIELKMQDSIFFELGFHKCDFNYLESHIAKDLKFFHDQIGMLDRNEFLLSMKKNICSNPNQKPIRKLEQNSLQVFPLYKEGKLYGAIQSGIHDFYIRELNKEDVNTSRAKFTNIWVLEKDNWFLQEVLSYDHNDPIAATADGSFEKEIEQLLIKEKVPALGLGIIENGRLKQIQVFGNIDKDIPASYNSIFKVASLTKPITALVTLKLISAGKLGLDEPLDKYWKDAELKNDKRTKKLTPRVVLSHQTGFPNWRYLTDKKTLSFEFDPGTKFQYSGEGFEYLRKALEVKFGKSLETLAEELVFKPAKMTDSHFWWDKSMDEKRYVKNYDKDGKAFETVKYYKANAAANLLTTVEDYGNFLTYILSGADLSQSVFEEMTKNQVRLKDNDYFGLGWQKFTGFRGDEYALVHTGSDPGVFTLAIIFPKSKNGYIIFLNGDNHEKIFEQLLTKYMYLGNELWDRK